MSQQNHTEPNRETIALGWATPQTVIEYYQGVLEDHPELVYDLQALRQNIDNLCQDDSGWRIATAIACAILNRQFNRTGILFGTDTDGEFGTVVYEQEHMRLGIEQGILAR